MVASRQQVLETIEQHQEALRSFGVRKLQLFGSAARNEVTADSDLDFVVDLVANTLDSYMGLKYYLEEVFGCPVDLVLADAIKPRLRDRILGEAIDAPGF
jgi:uncharacterized protein